MKKGQLGLVVLLAAVISGSWAAGENRPLVKPNLNLCRNRPEHFRFGNHRYLLSWKLDKTEHAASAFGGRVDWLTARNFCRERFSVTANLIFVLNLLVHLVAIKFILIHDFIHDQFNHLTL
jgi:hypothetical protein